jgi:hypothetical protein
MAEPTNLAELIAAANAIQAALADAVAAAGAKNVEAQDAIDYIDGFKTAPVLGGNLNLAGFYIFCAPSEEGAPAEVIVYNPAGILLQSLNTVVENASFPKTKVRALSGESTTLYAADDGTTLRTPDVASYVLTVSAGLSAGYSVVVLNPFAADITFDIDEGDTLTWTNGAPEVGSAYTSMWLLKVSATAWEVY